MTSHDRAPGHTDAASRASSRHRYRQAGLTSVATMGAKSISILTAIVIVPLALGYLGTERYGIWLTLSSFLALLGFMDLGLGNAVMTAVARTGSADDRDLAARYVSTGFFMLIGIAAAGAIVWLLVDRFVVWADILDVQSGAAAEIAPTLTVLIGMLLINLPLGVAGRTQWGLQRGYISSAWQAAGSIVGLLGLILVIEQEAGLPWMALAILGGIAIAELANSATMFAWWGQWCQPTLRLLSRPVSAELARLGGLFLGLQMAMVVSFASDNLIVARLLGVESVPNLSIPFRMFGFVPMLLGFVVAPLWPAYGDAIAKRDFEWVKKTLRRSLGLSIVVSAAVSLLLVGTGNWLLDVWTGGAIGASMSLLIGLAVWTILNTGGTTISMLLNAAAVMKFQLVTIWTMAVAAIILKLILIPHFGVAGAIWATVISYSVFVAIPYSIFLPRFLSRMASSA